MGYAVTYMVRKSTSILFSPEERKLLRLVAAMYDLSFGGYLRAVGMEHARRAKRAHDMGVKLPRIERIVIDDEANKRNK